LAYYSEFCDDAFGNQGAIFLSNISYFIPICLMSNDFSEDESVLCADGDFYTENTFYASK